MTTPRPFPDAQKHGDLEELFPDIFFVTGTVALPGLLPLRISRNMTVLRHGSELTLVNSVRLDSSGLEALDKLGKVKNIIRLAAFHGMDDPFYKDRYGATVWSVDAPYFAGFDSKSDPYFHPDNIVKGDVKIPTKGAEFVNINSAKPNEGLMLLDRDGGILIAGDSLQNWDKPDQNFSFLARLMMPRMGFIKPCNVGPGWRKATKPDASEIKAILDLGFEHVLPAHGAPVIGDAKKRYAPVINAL